MTQPCEDGNLPAAKEALQDAVHAISGSQTQIIDDKMVATPSRYLQLRDSITGEQINSGGGRGSKSRPPCWLDALDKLNEIDTTLEIWQPTYIGVPPTVGRLRWLLRKRWRPMDVKQIEQMTEVIDGWAAQIDALLNPPRKWTLPSPCPACGATIVQRRDSAGETVRQPALQVGVDGCHCVKCRTVWGPHLFTHLARVLGYEMPSGVLE